MKIHRLAAACAALLVVAGVGAQAADPSGTTQAGTTQAHAKKPSTTQLSIGVFPAMRPLELVRGKHWLEDAGYTVAWHDFPQGIPAEAAAMAGGSIDLGEADTSGIQQVAARSPGVMWYVGNGAMNYVALVARKDSGIKTVADLKGRRVGGVAPNTAPTAVLELALAHAGLSLRDLQGLNIIGPSQPAALERGAIDAAISYVPYSAETITAGTSVLITTASDVYGKPWLGGGIVVRPDFAKAHPDVVVDVLRAVMRAEKLLREEPDDAYKALAAVSHTSLQNVTYAFGKGLVQPVGVVPDRTVLTEQAAVLKEFHVIDVKDPQAFIDELVHPEFAQKAAEAAP
ncbi:MAG: hypothetical protein BGO51_03410 [Rhodospirillales bacterium 69-11]|nr:ABC transporter substrate-binding protein [Rhodospirillales bacterium]OJW17937.1 MAG: hypothetical protein BGO51_03410 [Rhodospirillales bacterium 69-11]